jgi:alpha-amylase
VDWDNRARENGIYRIVGGDHEGWSPNADKELGNYDYLLGVDASDLCFYIMRYAD